MNIILGLLTTLIILYFLIKLFAYATLLTFLGIRWNSTEEEILASLNGIDKFFDKEQSRVIVDSVMKYLAVVQFIKKII